MTDLGRLKHQGERLERELLRSAEADAPPHASRARLLGALGIGAATLATAAQASAVTTAVSTGAQATLPLGSASKLGMLGIAKWVGGGVAAGVITAGSVAHIQQVEESGPARVQPSAALAMAPPKVRREARPALKPAPSVSIALPPTAPAAFDLVPEPARTSVTDEVRVLDQARAELKRGRLEEALASIAQYRQRFPNGTLAPEAELVRLQAFAKLGDRSRVAAEARTFLHEHPESAHAPQVRALLGQAEAPAPEASTAPPRSPNVARFPVGG